MILTSPVALHNDAIYRAIRQTISLHNPKIQQDRVKLRSIQQKLLRGPSKYLGTRFTNKISQLQRGGGGEGGSKGVGVGLGRGGRGCDCLIFNNL